MQHGCLRQGCSAAPRPCAPAPSKRPASQQLPPRHNCCAAAAAADAPAASASETGASLASEYEALQKWLIDERQLPVQYIELGEQQSEHFGPQPICTAVQDLTAGQVRPDAARPEAAVSAACPVLRQACNRQAR